MGRTTIKRNLAESRSYSTEEGKPLFIFSAASTTRGTGRTYGKETGDRPETAQADCRQRGGRELTKVWFIGAALELDSSGAGLYQEMSHQLMGHVPWDEEKEMSIGHFSWRPPTASQHRFVTWPVSGSGR